MFKTLFTLIFFFYVIAGLLGLYCLKGVDLGVLTRLESELMHLFWCEIVFIVTFMARD